MTISLGHIRDRLTKAIAGDHATSGLGRRTTPLLVHPSLSWPGCTSIPPLVSQAVGPFCYGGF